MEGEELRTWGDGEKGPGWGDVGVFGLGSLGNRVHADAMQMKARKPRFWECHYTAPWG